METNAIAEKTEEIEPVFGSELPESVIQQGIVNDPDETMKFVIDTPEYLSPPLTVNKTVTSTGARIYASAIEEDASEESDGGESMYGLKRKVEVKEEPDVGVAKEEANGIQASAAKKGRWEMFDEFLKLTNTKVMAGDEDIVTQTKQSEEEEEANRVDVSEMKVKEEPDVGFVTVESAKEEVGFEISGMAIDELPHATNSKVMSEDESCRTQLQQEGPNELEEVERDDMSKAIVVVKEESNVGVENQIYVKGIESNGIQPLRLEEEQDKAQIKQERPKESEEAKSLDGAMAIVRVKEEPDLVILNKASVKEETIPDCPQPISTYDPFARKRTAEVIHADSHRSLQRPSNVKKERVDDRSLSCAVLEDGDFPEESDWLLVGRNAVTGLSTTKGRKLMDNEIVHFAFPSLESRSKSYWMNSKAAAASSGIVRFSTKRYGEIGRLPMEWGKCLIPLVNSTKVKVHGRCIAAPSSLHLMQEIMLYVSFYIHLSVFTDDDKSSWRLDAPHIDSTTYPLLTLFKLLKINPFQKAEFTPEDLDSRKRLLNLEVDLEEAASVLPAVKRGKASQQYPEQSKDEQAISESSLNKLVGAADLYNLEEMEPPNTLMCNLKPYQKQALYWMSESEKGMGVDKAAETLHPCWAAYRICDERASAIYVNIFSGEATTHFPTATQMARGGILADAMGLGKTVMTIALILARPDRGSPDGQKGVMEAADDIENIRKKKKVSHTASPKVKGGTLVVCPMALLGQWKDELETHSKRESISIFVHYGGDRTNDPEVMSEHDVVLTTYGVLSAAYKSNSENSIFHRVDWYRVVLDEAHTIKSSKTIGAQAAYALSSHCRWCLTGTPLQNNLEDIFSLLCFLHVEPWCNWAWWNKLIQRPYENGDLRGLKLIKAILRPLMLRRTKETKDKAGRPILVLPPTDIQIIECEQSEAEHDFYDALFRRSKVQFDQFVEQGKVLHNYASILELLLRLRQCCNHPFLVMSRADSEKYSDLNKLAKRFLETITDCANPKQSVPTRAYIEEVVEDIRRGENTECPICLESADDPVLTPCAHRMCRECLLSSWRSPATGLCPICRKLLKKNDLITCPSENKFRVDVEKNCEESSKVTKLLDCLERLRRSGSGQKSIVFSQWTSFFDLLEIPLKRKGIGFLRFDGKLVQKQRERVLKEFSETEDKMVLLMSLRAGGVGLNLTAASNVFLMDPWWNPAVEEQAIMRIHRIGQKRTVQVRRFIVKDTVEERMQQVQARKQRMIAGALTDEEVRSARIEELKMLFR